MVTAIELALRVDKFPFYLFVDLFPVEESKTRPWDIYYVDNVAGYDKTQPPVR